MTGFGKTQGGDRETQGQKRIRAFGLPRDDFDPSTASESELIRFGLPTLDAMTFNPLATAFRHTFLQQPADGRRLRFASALPAAGVAPVAPLIPLAAIATQPVQKSVNWSGGYVASRGGHSFVSVMANWTVPSVSIPPGGTEPDYRSSTWIGLDGQKFYLDSSLPQIGTSQRCRAGAAGGTDYGAWFQWWARDQGTQEESLLLPISPGDEISAIIRASGETAVICNMKNVTKGIMLEAFTAFAPGPCRISGATAEWIMERPSPPETDGWKAYDLPAYASFAFTDCIAESRGAASPELHDHGLETARLIRMYEITANPRRVRTISTARRILDPAKRLELTYVAP
jgi:hypothetical protein